ETNCSWPFGIVMRPMSIATTFGVLDASAVKSSITMLFLCSTSSVRSGRISLTLLTRLVFPTPKSLATRIFMISAESPCAAAAYKRTDTIDHYLEYTLARELRHRRRAPDLYQRVVEQVAEQDTHDPERKFQIRRYLGDRQRGATKLQDHVMFGLRRP